jgi:nitrate reductase molybdenum cofactor assembly chaperone NarJ/NarW
VTPAPDALRRLAGVLTYPGPDVAARAAECVHALAGEHPAAAARLRSFAEFARAAGPSALEEAYTRAFDLAPVASPYVGDQLFGASAERSYLLAGLCELQREAGLAGGAELPDHVSEVLRLVAAPIPSDVRDDLLAEGLAPALEKMLAALELAGNPWADAVAAAMDVVTPRAAARRAHGLEVSP